MAADDLAQLVTANRERGGRHSPLYAWMRARHDALAAAIEADGASWPTIATMLVKAGLTDGTGKAPTPERARKCWHQVRKDVAAARTKAEAKRKPLVSFPLAAAPPLPSPVPCEPRRPADQDPAFHQGGSRAAEKVQAAYASLRAREIPLPERINPSKAKDR